MSDVSLCVIEQKAGGKLLTLDAVRDHYFGGAVTVYTIRRWIAKGVGNPRIKLPALRVAGRWFLRATDVDEFLVAVSDPAVYVRREKSARAAKAKRRLQRRGA